MALLSKELAFKQQFYVQTTQRVLTFILSVILAVTLRSYWALIWAPFVAVFATAIFSYILVPYVPRFQIRDARELFGFSIWLSLSQGLAMINWRFDQLVIGYCLPKVQLGYYVLADNVSAIPLREAVQPLAQTLFPGFAKLRSDPAAIKRGFRLAQSAIAIGAFPMAAGLGVVADPFVRLVMGERWLPTIPIIQVFCLGLGFQTLGIPLQGLAMAGRQTKVLFWRDLRGFFIRVPLVALGVYYGGLQGVVWARTISVIAGTLLNMQLVNRLIGLSVGAQLIGQWRTILATLAMTGGTLAVGALCDEAGSTALGKLVVLVALGAAIYTGCLFALWRASGRPASAEAEALHLFNRLTHRFRKTSTV